MIALNFTRTELELLFKAIVVAAPSGWPTGDDKVRVSTLKHQLEDAIAALRAKGWRGGNRHI